MAAATRAALSNGNASTDVKSLNTVTGALGGLSLTFLGPRVVDSAAASIGIWVSHDILTLVGSGTGVSEIEFSVVWSLAISFAFRLIITEDILELQVSNGIVSWETVGNGG